MRVIFVCTANMVRSPLSEYLLRRRLAERGLSGVEVQSAGTHAVDGSPALASAISAGVVAGLDLSPHRARRFSARMVAADDLVLVMERLHERLVRSAGSFPPEQVRLLGSFAGGGPDEIGDPVGGPQVAFGECLDRIDACLEGLLSHLEASSGAGSDAGSGTR